MAYEVKEVLDMIKIFHEVESSAKDFLFISSFPMKNKDQKVKVAKKTILAIQEYRKLPDEIRAELEKDKENNVSRIAELEKLCKETII